MRNQGNGSSDSSTLRYYRSTDSTITTGDAEVGTDSVTRLGASASGDEWISLTAPSDPGTYYYGACVDEVAGESDTTNNCSSAASLTVGASTSVPGPPTALTATANGQTQINLSWTAPSDDGGTAITDYRIEVSTNGSVWSDLVVNTRSTATSYSHTGLTAGSTRHYRVSAINSVGTGPASITANSTTDPQQVTSACASGSAVPNAADNPGLAADCDTLLAARDTLARTGTLNWSANVPIVNWDGITVGGTPRRVTKLDISTELTGTIPPELGNLANLESLYLWSTQLSGEIPSELGNLTNLTLLVLDFNNLTGTVPIELGNLTNLERLSLDDNLLTGTIPSELGNLTKLANLSLWNNRLTGTVPTELGNLTNLERLSLSRNLLTGTIPSELSNLTKLMTLGLSVNQLSGDIPSELGSLTNLTWLGLDDNRLSGKIPAEFGNLNNVKALLLRNNRLTGEIPAELANLSSLRELSLADNQLTGCIPAGLRDVRDNDLWSLGLPDCVAATAPAASTGLTATADGQTEIDLSWNAPSSDGGANITGYKIEVSTNGSTWSDLVANTNATSTTYTHTGLMAGSTRHYRVSAINSAGTGPASNTDSATTDAGTAPDLVVDALRASDSRPTAGASFTLSATVNNQGNGTADSTTLRYYRSTDSTITTGDTEVGTDSVSGLNPSGSSDESISLTAPSTPETYYYGACVDSVTGESDTANNCSAGVAVTVPTPTQNPTGMAVTARLTGCVGQQRTPGIDSYEWTVTGSVTANRAVLNVRVTGTFNGIVLGIDVIGDMEEGDTESFSITGFSTQSVGSCGADIDWLEYN